jgi:sugar-specific transcriptional regulator TrmB
MLQDNDAQILSDLGLTILEARVYLALAKAGKAKIRTISKISKVARSDIYRTLAKLQEKGLVEKIIAIPTEFKPIPIGNCISILIKRKKNGISETEKKATILLQKFKEKNSKNTLQEDESRFSLFPEQITLQREKRVLEAVQESFDVIASWKNPHSIMFIDAEGIAEALRRGVEIRVIVDKPDEEKLVSDIIKPLEKYSTFKIKYLPNAPEALMSICDDKGAWVCTCTDPVLEECPTLWTNNPCLLSVLQEYFDILWLTAAER